MKAMLSNDMCFSTVGSAFNSDGMTKKSIDLDAAYKAFDFDILKHQSCTEDGRPLPKQWHLRRSDDDSIIPTRGLGAEFQPLQHHDVFKYIMDDIIPNVPEATIETVGTINGGGTGILMAKFGDTYSISGDKSPHESRIFFFNPNGQSSLIMGATNTRLFCENQLRAAITSTKESVKNGKGIRVFHTTNASAKLDDAIGAIYKQVGAIRHIQTRQERLADIEGSEAKLIHILNRFFPMDKFEEGSRGWTRALNQRNEVLRQWDSGETSLTMEGDTAWKMLNCLTYPLYNPITIGKETDRTQIAYSGIAGSRSVRALEYLSAVEEEVGVRAEEAA